MPEREKCLLPQYLIKAEAFMQANVHQQISLADIANAAGCTERATVRMFEQYREMHPLKILDMLRSFD
jgi:transcriptional regulator GlxA family with amidase domain